MLEETKDGWRVGIEGFELLEIGLSGQVTLTAWSNDGKGQTATIALLGEFRLRDGSGQDYHLSAEEDWASLVPLFSLRSQHLTMVIAARDGSLHVEFESGARLDADPHAAYESWQLWAPDDVWLVSPPGGGDPVKEAQSATVLYRPEDPTGPS
jgi:hypothetical protein